MSRARRKPQHDRPRQGQAEHRQPETAKPRGHDTERELAEPTRTNDLSHTIGMLTEQHDRQITEARTTAALVGGVLLGLAGGVLDSLIGDLATGSRAALPRAALFDSRSWSVSS